ncbi:hypothetical protein [Novosphingobium terrae]|uniref:hypothetical protein n=1 Tax=Novosphingobium terrae TaxID=2726189 RepID=UPI00197DF5A5|nr:hypothetical protein [Novosphingobium terrae]
MGDFPLLDLMVPPPKLIWRGGAALERSGRGHSPSAEGDLQWLAHDYRDPRKGGRWFRFNARERIWECLDPFDQTGVNLDPDQPPAVNAHGRLIAAERL